MKLIVLRHGKAEPHGHPEGDGARALIDRGWQQARKAGALVKDAGLFPDIVLASPLVRTRQTAEAFCEAAGIASPIIAPWLACGMHPQSALAELSTYKEFQVVAIVGHEPDLSGLIRTLIGASGPIEMRTGSMACLEVHPPSARGALLFLVPPKLT